MFDPSDDFAAVTDGLVPVTVMRPGSSARTDVAGALRQAVRAREIDQSPGRFESGDVVWHLPAAELPEPPQPGDVILDPDGVRWTVLDVRHRVLGSRWRCVARNLALFHGLDDYVDIEKAGYTKGSGGADEVAWHVWRAGLRARIEPLDAAVRAEHGKQSAAARFRVYLAEDVPVDHLHRIKAADGTVYAITGHRKAERIDALMEIDVVRVS